MLSGRYQAIFEVRLKDDNRIVDITSFFLLLPVRLKGNPLVLAYLRQNAPSKLKQHLSAIAKPSITAASFQTAESSTRVNTPSSGSLTALLDNAHIGALQPNSVEERRNVDEPGALANAISGVQPDNSQERNSAPQSSETLGCSGSEPRNSVDGLDSTPDGLGDTLATQNIVPSNDQGCSPSRPSSGAQQNRSSQCNNRDNLDIPQRNANCPAATRGRRKRPHQEGEPAENEVYEVEARVGFAYDDDVSMITPWTTKRDCILTESQNVPYWEISWKGYDDTTWETFDKLQ